MSNSSLIEIQEISPNRNSPRNNIIDTITIHCFCNQVTAARMVKYFDNAEVRCSCNYVVGYDGSIGLCVPEADRSWCSSSSYNDNRAVTIEVASDTKNPYSVTESAYKALVELVADICKRNGIKRLVWSKNQTDRVNHKNGCNMTVHRDFANKACPGEYLYSRMQNIADSVNAKLYESNSIYRVQVGAFSVKKNAENLCRELKSKGYPAFVKADKM